MHSSLPGILRVPFWRFVKWGTYRTHSQVVHRASKKWKQDASTALVALDHLWWRMRNHLDGYLEAAEREVRSVQGFFHGLVKLWELPSRSWRFAEELCLEHVDDEKESQEAWAYLARGFQLARRIIFSSSRWWCLWSFRPSRRLRITLGEANSAAGFRSISVSKMQDEHILLYKEQNNKHSRNDIIQWHLIIKGQPFLTISRAKFVSLQISFPCFENRRRGFAVQGAVFLLHRFQVSWVKMTASTEN